MDIENEKPQVSLIHSDKDYLSKISEFLSTNDFEVVETVNEVSDYRFSPVDLLIIEAFGDLDATADFLETSNRKAAFMDILVLTENGTDDSLQKCMLKGAKGYLASSTSFEKIKSGLHTIHDGGVVIEPKLAKLFWKRFSNQRKIEEQPFPYTEEDRTIIQFIAKGLSKVEVADVLGIPRRTVKTRLQKMYHDIKVNNQVSLVVYALKSGWIDVDG